MKFEKSNETQTNELIKGAPNPKAKNEDDADEIKMFNTIQNKKRRRVQQRGSGCVTSDNETFSHEGRDRVAI